MLELCPYNRLLTHSRFLLTLRSTTSGKYHSLILFRLSSSVDSNDSEETSKNERHDQLYAMESACPHLGADLSHADIEECDTGVVAVCPWHRYDFDLRTGQSETGLRACTYRVDVRSKNGEEDVVYIEPPDDKEEWRVVEMRGVSEDFADPPPPKLPLPPTSSTSSSSLTDNPSEPTVPEHDPPKTLMQWAVLILNTSSPRLKVERTRHALSLFQKGSLSSIGHKPYHNPPEPPLVPPRPASPSNPAPREKTKKIAGAGTKTRLSMLHALANIEQWAIDLAWDIIARYARMLAYRDVLPQAFFSDFAKVALDESKHFSLLAARIHTLSGDEVTYGDGTFPVHAGLWESALETKDSLPARLAIIHMVHEARGLDVNPQTIARFRRSGDDESVKVLEVIHADEVTHVTAGHRWFTFLCASPALHASPVDPVKEFRALVKKHWRGEIKGPFNEADRETAGLAREWYDDLRGDGPGGEGGEKRVPQKAIVGEAEEVRKGMAKVVVE